MLNALMLLGLFGLGVPVVIHLINRQRMRPQPLATLKFLDQKDVANAFAPVPRDLLQLILRLLLLLLFVLLMTRLVGPGRTPGPRSVAIVLDNSMSMQRLGTDGTTSLFELHRARALELVRGMNPDDTFSFALVGDKVFEHSGFTSDAALLEHAVTNAWVSDGGGRSLMAAVEDAVRELRSLRVPNPAVLVFSDQQRSNYATQLEALTAGGGGTEASMLARQLAGSRVKLVFVTDPLVEQPNVVLEDAEFYPPATYLGSSSKVTARLYNGSDTQQTAVVSLQSGPVSVGSRSCALAAGETAQVELVRTFDSPNDSAWGVNVSEDGFVPDNDTTTIMRMLKRRQVLLVAPSRYPEPEGLSIGTTGPDLFSLAVNPSQVTGETAGETFVSVKRIRPAELESRALSMYSMIVLYGLADLPSPKCSEDLVEYVRHGGGIYIIPDAEVGSPSFNKTFEPFLAGFQLGDILEPVGGQAIDGDENRVADPLLHDLLRGEWGTINDLRIARYFSTGAEGELVAALRTARGDTLLGVASLGEGQVCIQTHSWNVDDTSFPRSLCFVPVVHAIIDRLTGANDAPPARPDAILVGDSHRLALAQFRGLGGEVILKGPRDYAFAMSPEDEHVTVKDIYVAGAYRVTHPGKFAARERWLTVNRSTSESDLTVAGADDLAALCGGREVVAASDQLDGLFSRGRELYPLLMILVLAALLAESLGSVFGRRKGVAHEPAA
ncbi:MAG: hypothetical protein QGH31_09240 [Kiritimatiellia bacterium]|nr:hypothetical protein [Kiritimatiellia bacterium]